VALAPMVLQWVGVSVPSGVLVPLMTGQTGCLADGTAEWIRWSRATCPPPCALMETSPEDMAHMSEQLRKLGYR